jgi:hypothetical protein
MYPACTFLGPFVYLRCTWGRLSARPCPRTAVVCPPSLSRAARAWRAEGASVLSADAVPVPLPGGHADARRASGPAGVQRLGLRHRERRHGGRRSQGTTACSALEGHQRALHAARPDSLAHVGRGDGHPNVVPRLYLSVMLPSGLTPNPHAPRVGLRKRGTSVRLLNGRSFHGTIPGNACLSLEEHWLRDELARQLGGITEAFLGVGGRADVLTPDRVFEVKPAASVRGLVDDAVDGGDPAADVHQVALADAGQPLGDPGGRGFLCAEGLAPFLPYSRASSGVGSQAGSPSSFHASRSGACRRSPR